VYSLFGIVRALCTSLHPIPQIYEPRKTETVSVSEEANGFEAYEKAGGPGKQRPRTFQLKYPRCFVLRSWPFT
jgi:hypothetical protein